MKKTLRSVRPRRHLFRSLCLEPLEGRALLSTVSDNTGTLLLQLKAGTSAAAAVAQLAAGGQTSVRTTSIAGLLAVQGSPATLAQVSAAWSSNPGVQYVQPEQTVQVALTPNDPAFTNGTLWGLNGTNGIRANQAWNVTTGSPSVVVADIDTGIDYNHPDLYQNVWINQAEIPASRMSNLVDYYHDGYISWRDLNDSRNQGPFKITDVNGDGRIDAADILAPMGKDANGKDTGTGGWSDGISEDGDTAHIDDLIGWNFVSNTNNPFDDHGHGTHTAGTIAAMGNNGVGVVGVAFTAQIMALKFLGSNGIGSDLGAAEAIEYAAAHGARVSNNSWGGSGNDPALSNAIGDAAAQGEIFVAAAGNNATNTDVTPNYPSAFNLPNIIAVAAIGSDGSLASFSNYGATTVDVGAPGVSIYSTLPNNSYGYLSGTSMATPHVTGTVALVLAEHPSWTMSQVIDQILNSTTPDPALAGKTVTGGIINAALAVGTQVNTSPTLASIPDQSIPAGQSATVTLQGTDPNNSPLTYSALAQTQTAWLKQTYGIYEDVGGYYLNYRHQQEKYLRGTVSANGYNNGGGDYWYYILPNGDLYEFTPPYSNAALTGALVAHLGTAVYNDPSLLWNAQNTAVPVTLGIASNQLTITPNVGYTGTFVVTASDSNGQASASRSFRVTVFSNSPPTLASIPDLSIPAGQSATVTLQGSDPNNSPLTYSALAETQTYWLKQTYGIYEDVGGYYLNYRHQQEKYLRGTVSANAYSNGGGDFWYYILPNGDLYEFTPSYSNPALVGALVAHLGTAVYNDPSLLWNAQNTAVPVTLGISSNLLTITPNVGYTGTFVIIAADSNGQSSASRSFRVTVTASTQPTLAPVADQSIPAGQSATVTLQGTDPNNSPLTYSALAQTQTYWLKQTYGIYEDVGGYYLNYRHQQEKYLRGTVSANAYSNGGGDFWYYILPNGDLYEFTPSYSNPALVGALVAHLGTAVYNDPSLLWNAQNTAVPVTLGISGNQLTITPGAGYTGTFVVIASDSNGQASASRSFRVTVS